MAWDAFELNRFDRSLIRDDNLAALRGYWAAHSPHLLPRIGQLGTWLAKVSDQPAAVWWAAHQSSLHQNIKEMISWELNRKERTISKDIRKAWRSLFEAWDYHEEFHRDWFALKSVIKSDGWSSAVVRRFGEVLQPRFSAERAFWSGPKPPETGTEEIDYSHLLNVDVKYPETNEGIVVPDEWCAAVVRVLRQNLELGLALECEIGGYGLSNISPIVQDGSEGRDYNRTHGLSGAIIRFTEHFLQLINIDKSAAKREFLSWFSDDDTIFARLRIWASGNRCIVSDNDFGRFIVSVSVDAFWNSYHQRDLLLVLASRWKRINSASRKLIEQKLLKGPKRWRREKAAAFEIRRAWSILNRIFWLQKSGCKLSSATLRQANLLRAMVPDWKENYSAKAADSLEGRTGWVKTNTSHEELADTPLSLVLLHAKERSGRSEDFLVENDPFSGLVAQRPRRAFAALTYAAKRGEIPEWAWQRFLDSEARKNDDGKFVWLIAERLASYPDAHLAKIIRPSADWLRNASSKLSKKCLPAFDRVLRKLVGILRKAPNEGSSGIVRSSNEIDWTMEAINSPTGKIAEALFNDPRKDNRIRNQGFPSEWLGRIEALLTLSASLRPHALVILFRNLNWFFAIDPRWTEQHLLAVLHGADTDDCDAAWSGFLWGTRIPNIELYMRLKDDILGLACNPPASRRSFSEVIAAMVLAGWATVDESFGQRCISNNEMRDLLLASDDGFRSTILWQAQRWAAEKNEKSHEKWQRRLPELLEIRAGSGNLNRWVKWVFRATAA